MGSDSKKAYNALGRDELLLFDPETLVIVTDPKHPLFDERALLQPEERLILSIMDVGVIEPIVVRKNGEREKGIPNIEVVDGRQRVKAARIANHRILEQGGEPVRVPGVRRLGDNVSLTGVMITTNELRLADSPLIKAQKLSRYLALGRTMEEAAVTFGATVSTLKGYLSLLTCHPDVIAALKKGRIGVTHAKMLSAMPQEEQPQKLVEILSKPAGGEGASGEGSEGGEGGDDESLNEKIERALNGRGKVRQRTQKTRKEAKGFRKRLEGSRSQDAPLAIAMIDWFLGNDAALSKFRALKSCAEGEGEDDE
jgi:ParB family chromosome partitioning protein